MLWKLCGRPRAWYHIPGSVPGRACMTDRGSLPRSHNLHRSLQSAWQPTLSSASLAGYAPAMNAAAERLIARLSAVAAADGEADMLARFFRVAVDIVGTTVFGCAHAALSGFAVA